MATPGSFNRGAAMKKLLKKIRRSDAFLGTIGFIVSSYLKFVYKTTHWHYVGREELGEYIKDKPTVACFWHNRLTMIPFMWHWRHKKIVALISSSPIGTITIKAFKRLNIDSVGGSSNRNPIASYRELLAELKKGNVIGIIPDGPRGPALQAKAGFIHLASKSGASITPLAFAISRHKVLNTWDKMLIPLPFSRGVFIYGEQIYVPHCNTEDLEPYRLELEKKLTQLQDFADNLLENMIRKK